MIPIPAASPTVKFKAGMPVLARARAPRNAAKIPIWAAAPSSIVFLFEINGPKSVVAPIPIKIKQGYNSYSTPKCNTPSNPRSNSTDLRICSVVDKVARFIASIAEAVNLLLEVNVCINPDVSW